MIAYLNPGRVICWVSRRHNDDRASFEHNICRRCHRIARCPR